VANPGTPAYSATAVNQNKFAVYMCPADGNAGLVHGTNEGFQGNYVGCNGNTLYWDGSATLPKTGMTANTGVILAGAQLPLPSIIDGTSNTLLVSETLQWPTADDRRGRLFNSYQGETFFSTLRTPNSTAADAQFSCGQALPAYMPCTTLGGGANSILSARSFHSGLGGVNVGMCDGSVRFVTNSIDPVAWSAAGTRGGQESIQLP
jgi:prepilin-type processing-associated H-X9-DG protein